MNGADKRTLIEARKITDRLKRDDTAMLNGGEQFRNFVRLVGELVKIIDEQERKIDDLENLILELEETD